MSAQPGGAWLLLLVAGTAATAGAPSTHPAGGSAGSRDALLVFCALADENWDLYSWDLQPGRAPKRLTQTPFDELSPSLAHDRTHVIYQTADGRLWRLDLRGGAAPRPLPFGSDQKLDMHPAIAPDSMRVAVATSLNRATDDTDLIIFHQATGKFGPRLEMLSYQHFPCWSPDGHLLAFANLHAKPVTGSVVSEIWSMRADGQGMRQLTLLDGQSISPRWSQDGREVVFACNVRGSFDLWAVEVASRQVRRLTSFPAAETSPVFSPDGRSILFVSDERGEPELRLRHADGRCEPLFPFGREQRRPCKDPDWK